jgi:hypothetical protein
VKKPNSSKVGGIARINRQSDYDLWLLYRVKRYPEAKKCPQCGTDNKRRAADDTCYSCKAKVKAGPSEYVDDGSDCLSFDADMRAAIAALPPKARNEDRKAEYLPREFAADVRAGM